MRAEGSNLFIMRVIAEIQFAEQPHISTAVININAVPVSAIRVNW